MTRKVILPKMALPCVVSRVIFTYPFRLKLTLPPRSLHRFSIPSAIPCVCQLCDCCTLFTHSLYSCLSHQLLHDKEDLYASLPSQQSYNAWHGTTGWMRETGEVKELKGIKESNQAENQ